MPSLPKAVSKQEPYGARFSLLDVVRVLGGFLLVSAAALWWFTGTTTWGYRGKWLNQRYLRLQVKQHYVDLTLSELAKFDGLDPHLPIYVAVNGLVYDVSSAPRIYGPRGSYHKLAGKDAARVYVTGCFGIPEEYTFDLRGLDEEEVKHDIREWQHFYESNQNYWLAGYVAHPRLKGEPPKPCHHIKYPGAID